MTALPATQLGLFDAPKTPKVKHCVKCGMERNLSRFAWKDAAHTERLDVCNTCNNAPTLGKGQSASTPIAPTSAARLRAAEKPYLPAIDPQPMTRLLATGDLVPVFVNVEGTGQTIVGVLYVTSAVSTERLRKAGRYTRVRNWFVTLGCQVLELRRSIAAPLIEATVRQGRA